MRTVAVRPLRLYSSLRDHPSGPCHCMMTLPARISWSDFHGVLPLGAWAVEPGGGGAHGAGRRRFDPGGLAHGAPVWPLQSPGFLAPSAPNGWRLGLAASVPREGQQAGSRGRSAPRARPALHGGARAPDPGATMQGGPVPGGIGPGFTTVTRPAHPGRPAAWPDGRRRTAGRSATGKGWPAQIACTSESRRARSSGRRPRAKFVNSDCVSQGRKWQRSVRRPHALRLASGGWHVRQAQGRSHHAGRPARQSPAGRSGGRRPRAASQCARARGS